MLNLLPCSHNQNPYKFVSLQEKIPHTQTSHRTWTIYLRTSKEIQAIRTNTWTAISCRLDLPESGQSRLVILCPSSTTELWIPAAICKVGLMKSFEVRFHHFVHLHMNKPEETLLTRAVARLRIESRSCWIQRRSLNYEMRYDQLPTHFGSVTL